jgi:S-DNA-T family DNA segregation ATPase FtsK/SpoIIIE
MNPGVYVDRPPRIQPELPVGEVEIPAPPDKLEGGYARLIQIGLPLLTIVGYILVSSTAGAGRSPAMLIPMGLSVVASVAFSVYSYRREQQLQQRKEQEYAECLIALNKEMHHSHLLQRRFYHYNYPDPAQTFQIVEDACQEAKRVEPALRSKARLWERRAGDDDFGVLRLGMGTLPSTVIYTLKDSEESDSPQLREARKLEADSRYVSDIPVVLSLRPPLSSPGEDKRDEEGNPVPAAHALGAAGQREHVYALVHAMLAHYVVFHAAADAKLYVLASQKEPWVWTEGLPHSQSDEQGHFSCFLDQVEEDEAPEAFDEDHQGPLEEFLEGIRTLLAQRKIRLQAREDHQREEESDFPFALVIIDMLDTGKDPMSPFYELESDAAISILLEEGAALSAAVIFLLPERGQVPSGCQAIIEVEETTISSQIGGQGERVLHYRYAEIGVNSFRYIGRADKVPQAKSMTKLAAALAQLRVREGYGANLTRTVPFLDLLGCTSLERLELGTRQKWAASVRPVHANWLRAKVGRMSGNKARTLVFSAKRDGVHGMVAGSTGSGKSELLISLIMSMAVTYDPTVLNFVLVDYKGGGAFKAFEELPHCVDIVTNLEDDGVTRMFTAIDAEIKRRQALNTETGTRNIVEYRQKGLHQTYQPYPFLFIIIDEFAEMIASRPEYKAQLESITRVGRAQGVSLILAAQRPSGITDQMRSNIKFRICLRVETTGESREMLRRIDAAFLPGNIPGRGYLQVGNDEIELVQVAYAGDKYVDPHQAPVVWPNRPSYDEALDQEPPELYKAIVATLKRMARDLDVPAQQAPWPDFLPTRLSLSELLISEDPTVPAVTSEEYLADIDTILLGQERPAALTLNPAVNKWLNGRCGWVKNLDWQRYALRPVVGLIDDPYAAKQHPLSVDLQRGHVVMFGASGWGKTTFLRTLAVSLAATHSPDHLHMYILDLGGRHLSALENLPHVGALIIPDDEGYRERVEQLLRQLDEIVEERKTIVNNAGVSDVYQYNQLHPADAQPAMVVVIDNFVEFRETFGGSNDNVESVLDKFVTLARASKPYGIHFVISANQLNVLSSRLYSLFTERLTLKLADSTDYRAIVGGPTTNIPDIPGRGYVSVGRQPLSFQVARPIDLLRDGVVELAGENQELKELAHTMQAYIEQADRDYRRPIRIDALPKTILFKQILARQHGLALDDRFLERLRAITQRKWADSLDPDQSDWLKVTIGVISGNRLRELQLEAKKDGVHGMIAGGTGSGKSELLMTLIVGLALNYDPSILNFVLVDYKGGGAFEPFKDLPHCVDLVTNLNSAAVRRMFTAINAEMQRRQKLNVETGTKDIIEYRAKGLHLRREPYPHLFVIIDEYAEMITDNPEFKDELDRITRIGRSLGVNLLLAAQRPIGVSDQMRANIKFRICLRVEGIDTSREMLRRSDAAFLPSGMPGRGYLQVGNENIELMQVAYTGEKYTSPDYDQAGEPPKFYDVLVRLTQQLLEGPRPRTPWPPPLPVAVTTSDTLVETYLDPAYRPLITLNRTQRLALNPFIDDWMECQATWPGIDWKDHAMRAVVGLLDDPYHARHMPLVVDLTKGHSVIFGAAGWGKTTFLRALILSLAATHSPDEFQAHILDLGGRNMEVLGHLPHVGTVIMPDEGGYEERVQQLWRELNDVVDGRRRLFNHAGVSTLYEYNHSHAGRAEPAMLVAIDNFTEFIETFGNQASSDQEGNPLASLVALARQGKAFGIHFAIAVDRLNALSSKLYSLFTERFTLHLADASQYSAIVGGRITDVEEIVGRGYVRSGRQPLAFQVALPPGTINGHGEFIGGEVRQIRAIGRNMNQVVEEADRSYKGPFRIEALPKSSSYRQVLVETLELDQEAPFLSQLKAATQRCWASNASAEVADWLEVILGITSGNRKRTLHFEAKKDGVHGMIAGGTGSGKSELLMTLIVGLALNYSPDILNFVLVDYKGGGAFKPFEKLPHCVDIVTNLNKAAVHRMFTAINAEIRRRQALNVETGTKDIVEYRRKGLHLTHRSYPHLFVIIDEYAEMIDDAPEYRAELESITRVGRAQGVNLLLASQRPKGITDQMRANIKLRICLRVEELETSRELLRRPDAALLPNGLPGRGYLQVGNENLELIQVSFAGESQPDDRVAPAIWPKHSEDVAEPVDEDVPKFYDAAVQITSELVDARMAPKPWPGFLPRHFSLQSALQDVQNHRVFTLETAVTDWLNDDRSALWPGVDWERSALRPVVGLLDDPAEARQEPLRFDLSRNHVAVFGDTGSGKTTLLRTILVSLAASHSPDELHAYVLDLGGRSFRGLERLPHVGAVIYADEDAYEERLQRLLAKLSRTAEVRQQILSEADANNLYTYNARHPQERLPAVVVMIDNFAELRESHEALVENVLIPLLRRCLSVGISFVVASNVPTNLPSKLYNLFGQRATFKQANRDRYLDIVGRGAIEIDDIPGRGYVRVGRKPLLFHAAQPVGLFDAETGQDARLEAEEIQLLARHMQDHVEVAGWCHPPEPIRILPQSVSLQAMLDQASPPLPDRIQAVLGLDGELSPALFDLKRQGPHFAVVGPPLSGKTVTLYNWVLSLTHRYSPQQVKLVLIDTQRKFYQYGGVHQLDVLPHVLSAISEIEDIEALLTHLRAECELMTSGAARGELFVIIDNFDDFSEEMERTRHLPQELAGLARRYGRDGLHFVIAGMLDSGTNELRRRVLSANYGIGLRTAQAVESMRVLRTPPGLRGKELPLGRGYNVKSGQTSLLQVAAPHHGLGIGVSEGQPEDEEERLDRALDDWVERIRAKYPDQHATWSSNRKEAPPVSSDVSPQNRRFLRWISILERYALAEIQRLKAADGSRELVIERLLQMDRETWNNEEALIELLKETWLNVKRDSGLPDETIVSLAETFDLESMLLELEATLADEMDIRDQTDTPAISQ